MLKRVQGDDNHEWKHAIDKTEVLSAMITVISYKPADQSFWDAFNQSARNGHLLFDRNYMDYHSDRFEDASCMIYDDDALIALLPANRVSDVIYSHQGLTFGGLIVADRATTSRVCKAFEGMRIHFSTLGVSRIIYKALPLIYHARPAQEDLYALGRMGARLARRDVTTSINYQLIGQRSHRRDRGARKSRRSGVKVAQSDRWVSFWMLLTDVLAGRHGVIPTHNVDEIQLLSGRFPQHIKLFVAEECGDVIAGVVMFETPMVAHAQYIATGPRGREIGALDQLFDELIARYNGSVRFFDFGISSMEEGRVLNEGLIVQKEEFGGSAVVHDVYEINI